MNFKRGILNHFFDSGHLVTLSFHRDDDKGSDSSNDMIHCLGRLGIPITNFNTLLFEIDIVHRIQIEWKIEKFFLN